MELPLWLTKDNDNADIVVLLHCEIYHHKNILEEMVRLPV